MPTELVDLHLRPARRDDVERIAALYAAARAAAVPAMPPSRHTLEADREFFAARLVDGRHQAWLAEDGEGLAGYALFTHSWLDHLFVRAGSTGQGVGSTLLDAVKAMRPAGFCLWVFESNRRARAFYAGRGLVELERTDGSGNEDRAPDVRMAWPGADPLRFYRSLIDEVDHDLGELLARRTALTRVVQAHKRAAALSEDPGRDSAREADIVRRVAALAPELGPDRVARIVQTIIAESLAAGRSSPEPGRAPR